MSVNVVRAYTASDYAGIRSKHANFYYGYEEQTEDGENCFVADFKENGKDQKIVVPYSKLRTKADQWNCEECLLAGIALIFAKYGLERLTA